MTLRIVDLFAGAGGTSTGAVLDTLRAEARKTLAENATAVLRAATQRAVLMDALGITERK